MSQQRDNNPADAAWSMPDEASNHQRTWMVFGPRADIWGEDLVPYVQRNLALIARAISAYEPVTMLVRPSEHELAASLCGEAVELVDAPLDVLWMRDTGPTFVVNETGRLETINHLRDITHSSNILERHPWDYLRTRIETRPDCSQMTTSSMLTE